MSETGKQKREPGTEPLPAGDVRASGHGPLLAGGLLVAAAWLLTGGIPWTERAMATLLLGVIPSVLIMGDSPTELPRGVSRHWVYGTSGAGLWGLAALAFLATLPAGDVASRLGLTWPGIRFVGAWTGLLVVAGAVVVGVWRRAGHRESTISRFLLPMSRGERFHFGWLCVTAGVTEEIVYRGFLVGAVSAASGSTAIGVIVAALAFGLSHRYQGMSGSARAAALGALLSAPLLVLDSIVPAILAHALLDLFAGLWWRERLWEETIVPPRSSK